jgi:hypothetical protein
MERSLCGPYQMYNFVNFSFFGNKNMYKILLVFEVEDFPGT